jgi:hypothetical protein
MTMVSEDPSVFENPQVSAAVVAVDVKNPYACREAVRGKSAVSHPGG